MIKIRSPIPYLPVICVIISSLFASSLFLQADGDQRKDTTVWMRCPNICDPELYTAPFFDVYLIKDNPTQEDHVSCVDVGDINGDGLMDIVIGYGTTIHRNGTVIITHIDLYHAIDDRHYEVEKIRKWSKKIGEYEIGKKYPCEVYGVELADFDMDGDIDIMASIKMVMVTNLEPLESIEKDEIRIIWNDKGSFANETRVVEFDERIDYWINPHIEVADFDRDGDPDFVVGSNNGKVALYKNDGSGNFTFSHIIYDYGMASWGLATGDFNGDDYPDLVVSASTDPYENNTNFTDAGHIYIKINDQTKECFNSSSPGILVTHLPFPPSMGMVLGGDSQGPVEVLDYNKDSLPDIVFGGDWRFFLLIQQENGTFKPFLAFMARNRNLTWTDRFYGGTFAVADLDQDGYDDVISGGLAGMVYLLLNNRTYVCIDRPWDRCMYMFGEKVFSFPFPGQKVIIGPLNVTVNHMVPLSRVDFYLNGKLVYTDTDEPFEWRWSRIGFGKYTLYVEGFDENGEFAGRDIITVWKIL